MAKQDKHNTTTAGSQPTNLHRAQEAGVVLEEFVECDETARPGDAVRCGGGRTTGTLPGEGHPFEGGGGGGVGVAGADLVCNLLGVVNKDLVSLRLRRWRKWRRKRRKRVIWFFCFFLRISVGGGNVPFFSQRHYQCRPTVQHGRRGNDGLLLLLILMRWRRHGSIVSAIFLPAGTITVGLPFLVFGHFGLLLLLIVIVRPLLWLAGSLLSGGCKRHHNYLD